MVGQVLEVFPGVDDSKRPTGTELILGFSWSLSFLFSCLFFWSCSFSFVKTCYKICGEEIYKLQERIGGYRMTFQKWKLFFKIPIFWCRKWKLFFKIPIFWCRKWKLFFKIPIFLSNSLVGVPGLLHLHQLCFWRVILLWVVSQRLADDLRELLVIYPPWAFLFCSPVYFLGSAQHDQQLLTVETRTVLAGQITRKNRKVGMKVDFFILSGIFLFSYFLSFLDFVSLLVFFLNFIMYFS